MPGQTLWQAARDFFTLQGIKWFYENELHFDPPLSERLVGYRVDLYFVRQTGVVQSVEIHGEVLGDPGHNHFDQDWHRYSLDQVLSRYGVPSQVWLHVAPPMEAGAKPGYRLTVVYNDRGFAISYRTIVR